MNKISIIYDFIDENLDKMEKLIIKRRGHLEKFDERKVYASAYASCLSASVNVIEAEGISEKVTFRVKKWLRTKKRISSDEIFKQIVNALKKLNNDAAFMYETHRDIN